MPQTAASSKMVVLIQTICTHWEKTERGGASAVQRNRVPEALKLPSFNSASVPISYVVHRANYGGRNGFAEPTRNTVEVLTTEPAKLGGVSLAFDEDMLTVFYQYSRSQGAPERYSAKVEPFRLSPEQWGRVRYNGRLTDFDNGTWCYEKWVYNVGLFSSPAPSVFVTTEPVKVFTQMAHLW